MGFVKRIIEQDYTMDKFKVDEIEAQKPDMIELCQRHADLLQQFLVVTGNEHELSSSEGIDLLTKAVEIKKLMYRMLKNRADNDESLKIFEDKVRLIVRILEDIYDMVREEARDLDLKRKINHDEDDIPHVRTAYQLFIDNEIKNRKRKIGMPTKTSLLDAVKAWEKFRGTKECQKMKEEVEKRRKLVAELYELIK